MEFSANAFFDVYEGHANTFRHVWENREGAYHIMMVDIYRQARWVLAPIVVVTADKCIYAVQRWKLLLLKLPISPLKISATEVLGAFLRDYIPWTEHVLYANFFIFSTLVDPFSPALFNPVW